MAWTTIHNGLDESPSGHGYIDWVLSELYELRASAYKLATHDRYEATGALEVSAGRGVLANDIDQEYRIIEVDSYTQPADGGVTVEPDGSFTFTPSDGFTGTSSFTYRSRTSIFDDPSAVFVTDPATVVLRVRCLGDLNGDGQSDLVDFSFLAGCISAPGQPLALGCEAADTDRDGDVDLADFAGLQATFGCH